MDSSEQLDQLQQMDLKENKIPDELEYSQYLYYTIAGDGTKSCFIICGSIHMVTYRHGDHMKYEENDEIEVFSFNEPNKSKKLKVVFIREPFCNEQHPFGDFIIFESIEGKFEHYPTGIDSLGMCEGYAKIGLDSKGERMFDRGVIQKSIGHLYMGSTPGELANLGAGIFTPFGEFAGMVCGKTTDESGIQRDLIISGEICIYLVRNDPAFVSSSPPVPPMD